MMLMRSALERGGCGLFPRHEAFLAAVAACQAPRCIQEHPREGRTLTWLEREKVMQGQVS